LAARRRGRSRRAQQSAIPLVGYFSGRSSDSEELLLSSFRKGLEGRRLHNRLEAQAADIVGGSPQQFRACARARLELRRS
jgi:hypothetical protein